MSSERLKLLGSLVFISLLVVSGSGLDAADAQDDPVQLEPVRTFDAEGGLYAFDVSFSRDESRLASVYKGAHIHVWNPSTGERLRTLNQPMGPMKQIYKLMTGIPPATLALQFAPKTPWDASVLAAGYEDGVRLWDAESGEIKKHLEWNSRSKIEDVEFASDGVYLGAVTLKGLAMIWNARANHLVREFRANGPASGNKEPSRITTEVAFYSSPKGNYMATGGRSGLVKIWDWQKARESQGDLNDTESFHVTTLEEHQLTDERFKGVLELIFWSNSADATRLLSASADRSLRIWSVPEGELLETVEFDIWPASAVALSPDRTVMALGRGDTIEIRSIPAGDLLAEGHEHTNSIQSIDFSPSGQWIATGSGEINPPERDDRVILWKNPFYGSEESSGSTPPEE